MRLIFWIGSDYFSCYLDEHTFNQQDELISEDLLNKLIVIYEQSTSALTLEESTEEDFGRALSLKRIFFTVEGTDVSNELEEYLDGQRVHTDLDSKKKFIDESDESDEEVKIVNYENFLTN